MMETILAALKSDIFAAIVGIATFLALLLAVFESWNSRRTSKHLEGQSKDLEAISQAMSTKVIGAFPDYLERLASILSTARKSITIVCAYPEHAHFSNPEAYSQYDAAIMKALDNPAVKVDMVVTTPQVRLDNDREQFIAAREDFAKWKADCADNLEQYFLRHSSRVSAMGLTGHTDLQESETWHQLQESCEVAAIDRWRDRDGRFEVFEVGEIMPVYIWIVDGKEAVFAILSYEKDVLGYAVHTEDRGLVGALDGLARRYMRLGAS